MTDPASLQALVIAANDERDWHICAHAEACRLGGEWRERAEAAEARAAQLEAALQRIATAPLGLGVAQSIAKAAIKGEP